MRRALFAWDGRREGIRTLHDAPPLLRQAKMVLEIATNGAALVAPDLMLSLERALYNAAINP
jgi:hypothetical protein